MSIQSTPQVRAPESPLRVESFLLLAALLVGLWLTWSMPVFSQEAYYWTYAQHPDWSYFDHPPRVAWLIWVGTHLLGESALGLRLCTWLCGCGVVLAGWLLLREFAASARARGVWLVLSCCIPTLVAVRFLANPDPPLACFWMFTVLALWKARSGSLAWWLFAGLMAGCALLSKYTAVFLAAGGLVLFALDPLMRKQLRRAGPYLGVAVAALTFSPVLYWNVANDFESFKFQTAGRWERAGFSIKGFFEFLSEQIGVLNPVVAVLVPAVLLWLFARARRADVRALWLLAFSAPLLAYLLASAAFVQVKMNWLAPVATPLALALALWWTESDFEARRPKLARGLRGAVLVMAALPLLGPIVRCVPLIGGTTWEGWTEIAACAEKWERVLDDSNGAPGNVFYFAADYRDAAQLTRNLKGAAAASRPTEPREPTLAQNVIGLPGLQFDHWDDPKARVGQDAIFVLPRPFMRSVVLKRVEARFESIERVETVHVRRLGIAVLDADVFTCHKYLGPMPEK